MFYWHSDISMGVTNCEEILNPQGKNPVVQKKPSAHFKFSILDSAYTNELYRESFSIDGILFPGEAIARQSPLNTENIMIIDMNDRRNRPKTISWALSLTLAIAATLSTFSTAQADDFVERKAWTTVGSAGTVDEKDIAKIVLQGSIVAFPEILPPTQNAQAEFSAQLALPTETTTATVRYNVTAVDGLFQQGSHLGMTVRFRDDGDRARVLVRLYEQDIYTGATALLLSFDSNGFNSSPFYQTQSVGTALPYWSFDFNQKAYFIEATLTKTSSSIALNGGRPSLAIIKLNRYYPIF